MHYTYNTSGTCSRAIDFDIEDGIITNVKFTGGCNGNLKGIGKLVEGMRVQDVATKLKGISCGARPTSCPDQLARACEKYLNDNK
ncbi:MAG: TIGR03905 family TSCPD domain-containing protein [Clostridia bacterium]|nr:TIGR03905 family TSCPD domain-containing protein [Clostridia bacterium]